MEKIKVRGLVLREYEAGESDKRLLIFCKEHGRILVYARGARKSTSKFMSVAQIFTYADFVLVKGVGFYSLAQAEIIENFYHLREDYDRLMAAYRISEICQKTLWDNIESDDLLRLVLRSLMLLSKGEISPLQITIVFCFRFFDVHGLCPQVDTCTVCDAPITTVAKIAMCAEGVVCMQHRPPAYVAITHTGVHVAKHILESEMHTAFRFSVGDNVLLELERVVDMLWRVHFDGS